MLKTRKILIQHLRIQMRGKISFVCWIATIMTLSFVLLKVLICQADNLACGYGYVHVFGEYGTILGNLGLIIVVIFHIKFLLFLLFFGALFDVYHWKYLRQRGEKMLGRTIGSSSIFAFYGIVLVIKEVLVV